MTERHFLCFYEGADDEWEAISVDYDIAVCGRSLEEAKVMLKSAILSYIEDAKKESESERDRLLSRRMPWRVRLAWRLGIFWQWLRRSDRGAVEGQFDLSCPA